MTAGPDIRIGDAEREATVASLREHYSHGRLTMEEFQERLDATFAAKTHGDLAKITRDLPQANPYTAPWPPQPTGLQPVPNPGWGNQGTGQRRTTPRARMLPGIGVGIAFLLLFVSLVAFSPFGAAPRLLIIMVAVFGIVRRIFRWIGRR